VIHLYVGSRYTGMVIIPIVINYTICFVLIFLFPFFPLLFLFRFLFWGSLNVFVVKIDVSWRI